MEVLSLLYTIKALSSSKPASSIAPNYWESPFDCKQHTHLRRTVKLKRWKNTLPNIGDTSWTRLETTRLPWHRNLLLLTKQVSITQQKKTFYEKVLGTKRQTPMSSKLGFYCNKDKFCCSEICRDLPTCLHCENNLKKQLRENLLRPQLSQSPMESERDFKQICSTTFEWCCEQTAGSNAYKNRFKLGEHLDVSQRFFSDNNRQDLSKSQKLLLRRIRPFTFTKRIMNTNYQLQHDNDLTFTKIKQRFYL